MFQWGAWRCHTLSSYADQFPMTDLQRYLPARLPTLDRMVAIVVFNSNCLSSRIYRSLFKRNAVYLTAIFASAFAFELCVTS